MKIPVHIAEKLVLLLDGKILPSSSAKHSLIDELVAEGIIERSGRIQKTLRLLSVEALQLYLQNKYSIGSLPEYIRVSTDENVTRGELVAASADSKLRKIRTFKGFLVNCYTPLTATLNDKPFTVHPTEGTFEFIYDFESFTIPSDVTVVGVENPENFRYIQRQQYLFAGITPLFVSRYPQNQSRDLIRWLQSIPNHYLHFGDFDFAGVGIYLNEFKKYLSDRAIFFVPENIDKLIIAFGNQKRYNEQKMNFEIKYIKEDKLLQLIYTIHHYKKGMDQEVLIHKIRH